MSLHPHTTGERLRLPPRRTENAGPIPSGQKTNADSLSGRSGAYRLSHRIDPADHFVAGNPWKNETWEFSFHRETVGVAHSACFNADSHVSRTWIWKGSPYF